MSEPAIRVEGLSKRYVIRHKTGRGGATTLRDTLVDAARAVGSRLRGRPADDPAGREEFWALRDVSFEVQPGEVVGVVGRNGAGKSTLLKLLTRITEPTAGRVELTGRVASLLEVGTGFHPELSGRENIFLNGAILGMSRAEIRRKFDEIVAFAEVEKFLDTPVKRYSSGMYVRLAFAVAAHLEPEILIVDEVLAVGDTAFQKKCLGKMGEVAKGGRTVLFVSHNMQTVARLTQSLVVMARGRVKFRGPTPEGLSEYAAESFRDITLGDPYRASAELSVPHVEAARVRTSDPNGEHRCGQPAEFEFDIRVSGEPVGLCFSFQICDASGQPVCHFWLLDRAADFRRGPGLYRIRCEVPKLRLYLGRYTLTTYLTDRGGGALLESAAEVCPFEVTMRGLHRAEYEWRPGSMVYWEDFAWSAVVKGDSAGLPPGETL